LNISHIFSMTCGARPDIIFATVHAAYAMMAYNVLLDSGRKPI